MNYKKLLLSTELALNKLTQFISKDGSSQALESIKIQLIFIRDSAIQKKNPFLELSENQKFTYVILASREFSSPEELIVKDSIDDVTRILNLD
jgi:hypothetical protein